MDTGNFKTDGIAKEKIEKIYKEYERYGYPVIVMDRENNIVYKNNAAKMLNIKPRVGTNIKKYIDFVNLEKLCDAVEKSEYRVLKLEVASTITRCVIHVGKKITALHFYDALNFLKDDADEVETIRKIEDIISKYNERRKTAGVKRGDGDYFTENKKIIRINEHFRKHMIGLNMQNDDKHKIYCDIGAFFNNFAASISQYISTFGYKMNFHIEDKMFYYRLSENDLLLINFIMSAFAFRHSMFNKVNISFSSDDRILRYGFTTGNDFYEAHRGIFVKDYVSDINDIEYLDLNLAALIAKNNDLKLRVYYDQDGSNLLFLDLIFPDKISDEISMRFEEYHITSEQIGEQAEIEFADVLDKY
ncbi:MAG: hypothetical protein FWF92_08625 [Oscillospiraceae bacterium]|nr:hypothetical protein [Oscillospiraceae bacterium]